MKLIPLDVQERLQTLCGQSLESHAHLDYDRKIERRTLKLFEEGGEVSKAHIKKEGTLAILEELWDTISVAYDIMNMVMEQHSFVQETTLAELMHQKMDKWESKIKTW